MRTIQTGILMLGGILAVGTVVKSQAPAAPVAATIWEYSTVTAGISHWTQVVAGKSVETSSAIVCYGNSDGCREEKVTSDSDDSNSSNAILKAATSLGSQGWELTSVADPSNGFETLYFRRPMNRTR